MRDKTKSFLQIIIMLILIFLFVNYVMIPMCNPLSAGSPSPPPHNGLPANFDDLLDAIEWVESKGDANAIGDGGRAVGAYQLHKIYVDDVNRINVFGPQYVYGDRLSKSKSREMVRTYLFWYIRFTCRLIKSPECKIREFEYMARIHNGGPRGHLKDSTKQYWEKIKCHY